MGEGGNGVGVRVKVWVRVWASVGEGGVRVKSESEWSEVRVYQITRVCLHTINSLPLWQTQLFSDSLVESSPKHLPSRTSGRCTLVSTLVLKLS